MGIFNNDLIIRLDSGMGDNLVVRSAHRDVKVDAYLMVPVNTEAVVVVNGTDMKIMQSGKHEIAKPKGEKKIDIDITFINNEVRLQSLWGTPSHIEFIDVDTKMPAYLGASGTVVFEINNTMKVYKRLLGTGKIADVKSLVSFLKSIISLNVKDIFARKLVDEGTSYFDLASDVKNLSEQLEVELTDSFDEYGVVLKAFTIDNIVFPEDIKATRIKLMEERYMLQQKDTSHAQLRKEELEIDKEERDSNERVVTKVAEATRPVAQSNTVFCGNCGISMPVGSKFCGNCGEAQGMSRVCSSCSTVVAPGSKFCQTCGKEI